MAKIRINGKDKSFKPQSPVVAKLIIKMKEKEEKRRMSFQKKRLSAGLNLVQRNFAWSVQEEYGLVPMGNSFNIGPDLTNVESHDNCKYCFCRCVVNQMDSRLAGLRCEHCRFYNRSTPRRCYQELGNRSGSIAYILRHSSLHRPDRGTEHVEEAFIDIVTAVFKKWPVSCDSEKAPSRLSALRPRYREWIRFLLSGEEGEEESMVHWFTSRQHRNYLIMTQSYGLTDAVFRDGFGRVISILEAATKAMDTFLNISPRNQYYQRILNYVANNMMVKHSILAMDSECH